MARSWTALGMACVVGWAAETAAQFIAAPAPLLTLGSPLMRAAMEGANLPRALQDKVPDFRLKLDRSGEFMDAFSNWDERLRGVEIRLPASVLWVGYDLPVEGEQPRTTLSIRFGF